jgi:hypothetical protein
MNGIVLDSIKSLDLRKCRKEHFDFMKGEHFFGHLSTFQILKEDPATRTQLNDK